MPTPSTIPNPICPPDRTLMGPGPSDVSPRVLAALAAPTIGHLDPAYVAIMDQTRDMLRQAFRTTNEMTLAVSGTGSAGMECTLANLLEHGDEIIVCVNGVFGNRLADTASRYNATVHTINAEWGQTFSGDQIADAFKAHPNVRVLAIVHAETSTGAHQPLEDISRIVHEHNALLLVDAVTSLAGMDLRVDDWNIDAIYSGTQKCLSCPPGLAPVSFSPAAIEKLDARKTPVANWYLDLSMLRQYWGSERVYHHTAPINMTYALHEALRIVLEEGIDNRIARHTRNHHALRAGLEALGLAYIPPQSLTTLNAVHVPEGIDDAAVRKALLSDYGIEIGAGLGPFKSKAWRIGLMGESSTKRHVTLILAALEVVLTQQGHAITPGAALAAAHQTYETTPQPA